LFMQVSFEMQQLEDQLLRLIVEYGAICT
jgi:hypothetical protein